MRCPIELLLITTIVLPVMSPASDDAEPVGEKNPSAIREPDTSKAGIADYRNIRSLVRPERYPSDALRHTVDGILYVPRQLLNGSLYLAAKTGAYLDRDEVREKIENLIYLYREDVGWHPMFYWTTGYRPKYGARIFAKTWDHTSYILAAFHSADNWRGKAKLVFGPQRERWAWKLDLLGLLEKADDWEYYGLGADPENDSRNTLRSTRNEDFAHFTQKISKIQAILELQPVFPWTVSYLTYYHMRELDRKGYHAPVLESVFDIGSIKAFNRGRPVEQFYQEAALTLDTRLNQKQLSPGYRLGGYGGISKGIGGDPAEFFRTGLEAGAFIPVIHRNRILALRCLVDMTESTREDIAIPFSDLPQNLAYRGTPNRAYLRADLRSFIASAEYQWPAGPFLNAHVFADYLSVGEKLNEMGWRHGRYIAGLGVDFHFDEKELGRVEIGAGNEGYRISASLGVPLEANSRSDWN